VRPVTSGPRRSSAGFSARLLAIPPDAATASAPGEEPITNGEELVVSESCPRSEQVKR